MSALHAGILSWLDGSAQPSLESLNLPDTEAGRWTARAYSEQSALGWNVFFRGFWSTSWRFAQDAYFHTVPIRSKVDNAEVWTGRALAWFFALFDAIWRVRCDDVHGAGPAQQRAIRLAKCERAIHRLYQSAEDLPHSERHPFRAPMETVIQCTASEQELWITQTEKYLRGAFRRVKIRAATNQSAITDFFGYST
jgi:hypothetical protein